MPAAEAINTKTAERRPISIKSWQDALAEVERIETSERAGTLRRTGNWTVGQNCQHLGNFIKYSLDGFPFKAPFFVRAFGQLIKKKAVGSDPVPAGFAIPNKATGLRPDDSVSTDEGVALLKQQINRVIAGEQMTHKSPLFGTLTQEQWTTLHLKHMELHLSFLHPPAP